MLSKAREHDHTVSTPPLTRLLVFDLDGTLIDSSTDLCSSVNAALHHAGHPKLAASLITSFVGQGAATLMRRALSASTQIASSQNAGGVIRQNVFDPAFKFFLEYYRDHKLDATVPYPGVIEALQQLRSMHPSLPMAVLTNKPVHPARDICDALGLSPFFFVIHGGDSFPKKPAPDGLLAIIIEANALLRQTDPKVSSITPESVVMVGDSEVDVQTARSCGVRSLGCSYGLAPEALKASQPDLWSCHPSEWADTLSFK